MKIANVELGTRVKNLIVDGLQKPTPFEMVAADLHGDNEIDVPMVMDVLVKDVTPLMYQLWSSPAADYVRAAHGEEMLDVLEELSQMAQMTVGMAGMGSMFGASDDVKEVMSEFESEVVDSLQDALPQLVHAAEKDVQSRDFLFIAREMADAIQVSLTPQQLTSISDAIKAQAMRRLDAMRIVAMSDGDQVKPGAVVRALTDEVKNDLQAVEALKRWATTKASEAT